MPSPHWWKNLVAQVANFFSARPLFYICTEIFAAVIFFNFKNFSVDFLTAKTYCTDFLQLHFSKIFSSTFQKFSVRVKKNFLWQIFFANLYKFPHRVQFFICFKNFSSDFYKFTYQFHFWNWLLQCQELKKTFTD